MVVVEVAVVTDVNCNLTKALVMVGPAFPMVETGCFDRNVNF